MSDFQRAEASPPTAPALSVVLPVYNAEAFIADTARELGQYLARRGGPAELIIVDDGSTDATLARLSEVVGTLPVDVHVLHDGNNRGKGAAVSRGMKLARGAQRVFLDADLAYPPHEIDCLTETLSRGADVAIACRVHPGSRYLVRPSFFRYLYTRHLAGRVFNWIVQRVMLPGIRDTQAGLKGFTAASSQTLFGDWLPDGFSFDLALLFRARQLGLRVAQVPVLYRYDSEPTTVRFLLDTLIVLCDIFRIRWRLSRLHRGLPLSVPAAQRELRR